MSRIYDNWERLVAAALKKQQLWELFHEQSRSPSIRSEASDLSLSSPTHDDVSFNILSPGSSSPPPQSHPELVFLSDFSPVLDPDDMFLSFFIFLARGTFGSVYTAVTENGATIVVKRLISGITSQLKFQQNMEIVRNIKHENVVPLRAYYSSKNELLLLYDYYGKGSVYELLHGKTARNDAYVNWHDRKAYLDWRDLQAIHQYAREVQGQIAKRHTYVDWEARLKIAIGAARGIAEIHAQNGGKFVHGNIKSSNVFVNFLQYGCISDLGLANMVATPFLPTAWCYAPEVDNTRSISQASDVYSFGILILELLTRKSSVYIRGGPHAVDLVKLVTSVKSKEWAAKVFDIDLLKHPEIKEDMIKMLRVGIRCVAKSPERRPRMSKVVKMLEEISATSIQALASLKEQLVYVQGCDRTFDLDDILQASAKVLGERTCWTSYKVLLGNGNMIVVKRLKDVNVTFEEFQQHMEVIGRMRHDNVAELRAYYYSNHEKLLVYDYHDTSLSTLLHGKHVDGKNPLDWMARLKISVGAARGIAHIHRQCDRTLVHGNIKSANIFLNGHQYGLVTNAGPSKLTSPDRVSQAYDVYSFGVVLLELVTGRPSQLTMNDGEVVYLVKWIQSVLRDEWTYEVLDVRLLRDENNEEAMVEVLQIGMDCINTDLERRPKMPEVVKMLDKLIGIHTLEQLSLESSLEYLLEDLLHRGRSD